MGSRRRRWTRGYPPLVLLAVALLAVVLLLPSSLNLPQSNPSPVLEYAPVPPQDKNPPPFKGNLSSLSLGSSRTLAQGVRATPPPAPKSTGFGANPRQYQCIGNPPRQTEDPSSPPCVPFFQGDNFGPTYQGVTKNEITVLVYFDVAGYTGDTAALEGTPPDGTYVDIDKPALPPCAPNYPQLSDPNECDHVLVRATKPLARYFNARFQTYDRHVHFWAYFSGSGTAAQRRADAVSNWQAKHPFAVIDEATFGGFNQEYETAMNQLGVLSFGSTISALPNSFYRSNAPLSWGFYPDVEHWASMYSTYVCQKVAPFPVSHYGSPQGSGPPNGAKRKYGLWSTTDPGYPGLQLFAKLVKHELKSCGVTPTADRSYANNGFIEDGRDKSTEGAQAAADFQSKGVTTVLYLGGVETRFATAADGIRYYPEIVVAGSLNNDGNLVALSQNQNVWRNAWAMTFHVRRAALQDAPGYRACREGNPSASTGACGYATGFYRDHFTLFEAIQVAGPRLTPQSIDKGFHAIPPHSSNDPFSPSLYFDAGDYTAMKDAQEAWWDASGQPPGGNTRGCWRLPREGRRFLIGHWPHSDDAFRNPNDPCTGYGGGIYIRSG